MEQRPLRLGDIVDDYCPRERRITNHAIVAIVNDSIRQTRCTTCEAEHVYKSAKVPRRRPKDDIARLTDQVLANAAGGQLVPPRPVAEGRNGAEPAAAVNEVDEIGVAAANASWTEAPESEPETDEPAEAHKDEVWSGHRPLIRATLPRTEGDQPPPRPIPEFTMHRRNPHGGHGSRHRHGWQGAGGGPNGFPGRSAPGQGHGGSRRRRHRGRKKPR